MNSWFNSSRADFIKLPAVQIVDQLTESAAREGWAYHPDQKIEWTESVKIMRAALSDPSCEHIDSVMMEYNFKRRGLRMDFVLLAPGAVYVVEFKRGVIGSAEIDQVQRYGANLLEFHELTRKQAPKVFTLLVSRSKSSKVTNAWDFLYYSTWNTLLSRPLVCHESQLCEVLSLCRQHAALGRSIPLAEWESSPFSPSTQIVDATITLWCRHDVSAISNHGASVEDIERCTNSVKQRILQLREVSASAFRPELILVTGSPGAGKTLVGLNLNFSKELAGEAVFVTGNTPLVEVLNAALSKSYKSAGSAGKHLDGYSRDESIIVSRNADFKIVKAHRFLDSDSKDGRILIFDEAQRTYAMGTEVNRKRLDKDEADLIMEKMMRYERPVIVLLLGHNQNINDTELGVNVWFDAAKRNGWTFTVSDESLALREFWPGISTDPIRQRITGTHLEKSIRNESARMEEWVQLVLDGNAEGAKRVMDLIKPDRRVRLFRNLQDAKAYVRSMPTHERSGVIACGNADRLRAEGLFVRERASIAHWMLCPSGDIRSSNYLEQVQNQYQIQGLELDHALVCWDLDLRRVGECWKAFDIIGSRWLHKENPEVFHARLNSYRVLLTRSRKTTVIFVPMGADSSEDSTRPRSMYDEIARFLERCGAMLSPLS
jgi:hypothetical protein